MLSERTGLTVRSKRVNPSVLLLTRLTFDLEQRPAQAIVCGESQFIGFE